MGDVAVAALLLIVTNIFERWSSDPSLTQPSQLFW